MSVRLEYKVKSVDVSIVKEWILKKHYAKRIPPIEYCFGLYNSENVVVGICTFGTPVSHTLRSLWDHKYKVMELNRLVSNDNLEKNCLSYFVSECIKMLPKTMVIVSYADTSKNHNGYIYQATNFIYTGLSLPFKDYYIKGMEHLHNGTIMDMSRGKENRVQWLREKFGDDLIQIDRPQKHRYFFFKGNKYEKKEMRSMLPYDICPYPKGENVNYDASYKPVIQSQLF